jgi:hypothetical protein
MIALLLSDVAKYGNTEKTIYYFYIVLISLLVRSIHVSGFYDVETVDFQNREKVSQLEFQDVQCIHDYVEGRNR